MRLTVSLLPSLTSVGVPFVSPQSSALKQRLIGQDDAVDCVASALMRARCGLKSPNRPVASLLLVGPTGR